MTGGAPFVVVVAATAAGVGKSTLCENLAVYLKGLLEDLPVALISFDPQRNLGQTFEISGQRATEVAPLDAGAGLESRLTLGQFGVEYLPVDLGADLSPPKLRKLLRDTHLPGILIIDAGPLTGKGASAALQAADMVLAPIKSAAGLAPLAEIRREVCKGGGHDQMLCLIPALIEHRQVPRGQLELLRFAAAERGCQVLNDEFVREENLTQATLGNGGSVLTRLPQSMVHQFMYKLAQFVLQTFYAGPQNSCRQQRLQLDGVLPPRFKRVELVCPLCQRLAFPATAHYCESLPQRRRWLVHADCLRSLMAERPLFPFWSQSQSLVVRTGVEGAGLVPQLRLLLLSPVTRIAESEQFLPGAESGWQALVKQASGRILAELSPGLILIHPALSAEGFLSPDWYGTSTRLRRDLCAALAPEL